MDRLLTTGGDPESTFFSCSILNMRKPKLYQDGDSGGGLLLTSDTPLLCIYFYDHGTGTNTNGGCPDTWTPEQTLAVLKKDEPDSASWYNEAIVGRAYWHTHWPKALEAFIIHDYGGDGGAQTERAIREAHRKFLEEQHLCASQVPLLRYKWYDRHDNGVGFEDISPPPSAGCHAWQPPPCIEGRATVPGSPRADCTAVAEQRECERAYAWALSGEPVPCEWSRDAGSCIMSPTGCVSSPPPSPPPPPSPTPLSPPPPPPSPLAPPTPPPSPSSPPPPSPSAPPPSPSLPPPPAAFASVSLDIAVVVAACIAAGLACAVRRGWFQRRGQPSGRAKKRTGRVNTAKPATAQPKAKPAKKPKKAKRAAADDDAIEPQGRATARNGQGGEFMRVASVELDVL